MQVSFEDNDIRKICEQGALAEQKFGLSVAQQLRNRLSDIEASQNLSEMVLGKLRLENINGTERYILNLSDDFCLIMIDNDPRRKPYHNINNDLSRITRVKIMEIGKI